MSEVLFDIEGLPPTEVEKKSAGARLTEKRLSFIARGFHPLANLIPGLMLHKDAVKERGAGGPRCGTCKFAVHVGWWKCAFYKSSCTSSDLRLWWPGCSRYERGA